MSGVDAPPPPAHRGDIQGLRAVAVLLVVAFHAGLPLPGGWIGVDVFFVVSGFVLGRLLVEEVSRSGRIDVGDFFARRARRLLPALAAMLVVVTLVSGLTTNPLGPHLSSLRTAAAALVELANFQLYRHTGYFGPAADQNNLFLHTWSLSVEEQLYLVLPLLVWGCWRLRPSRRGLICAFGAIATTSFALGALLSAGLLELGLEVPERFAYYMLPCRAWEPLAGVLLAIVGPRVRPGARVAVRWVGFAAIGWGALRFQTVEGFRVAPLLLPVAGTCCVLAAGASGRTRTLDHPVLRWLGDRSYSWYLWHWPFLVLARQLVGAGTAIAVTAAVLALAPAAASTRWVEERFRRDPRVVGWRAARLGLVSVGVAFALVTGAAVAATGSWGVAQPDDWYEAPPGVQSGCHVLNHDLPVTGPGPVCWTGSRRSRNQIVVAGTDQAASVAPAVTFAGGALGARVLAWTRAGCPFLVGWAPRGYSRCAEHNAELLELIRRSRPEVVVIDDCVGCEQGVLGAAHDLVRTSGEGPARPTAARWRAALTETTVELRRLGADVVLVAPVIDWGEEFPFVRTSVLRPLGAPPSRARTEIDIDRRSTLEVLGDVASAAGATVFDPLPTLCPAARCEAVIDGRWRYQDRANLNRPGGELLGPSMTDALGQLLGT